ncbi:MAG: MBL fold metallo-hydrolase [Gammaproteobacteria bacterium]|jgi:glyoxylase-like metal-dependent hydrolase (beta-lactamase superfamily II)
MRPRNRRQILGAGCLGAGALALNACFPWLRAAGAQAGGADVLRLGEALHLLSIAGVNVLAHTAGDRTVLVDGGSAETSGALLAAAADLPGAGRIDTLFNTHWHPAQTGSNATLAASGATIIAQENTRLWLSTDISYPWDGSHFAPLPEAARPNLTFYDDGGKLESGVRYGHLPHAAHTDGDLYVAFPEENVLAVGGTITGGGWPFVDWWTGGWIGGIVGTLELLLSLADQDTRVVAARGAVMQRDDLERQYDMYNLIYERLAEMLNRGRGPEEAVAARPTAEFDAEMGPSEDFVRQAFQSLWAYLSPDA